MTQEAKQRYANARGISGLCMILAVMAVLGAGFLIVLFFAVQAPVLGPALSLLPLALGLLVASEIITMLTDIADNSHRQAEQAEEGVRLLRKLTAGATHQQTKSRADAEENAAMEKLVSEDPVVAAVQEEIVRKEAATALRCKACKGELPRSRDGQAHKIKCPTCGNWAVIR